MDKKTEEALGLILAIIGLVASIAALAAGLPEHAAGAIVGACGGIAGIAIGVWLVKRARSLPPFSLKYVKSTFNITKSDGSECRTSKEIRFRCNFRDQRDFVQRHIYADGAVAEFNWDGEGTLKNVVEKEAAEHIVTIVRLPSWPCDRDCKGILTYSIKDTFPSKTEWVACVCDRSAMGTVELEVQLPKERACKKAWAIKQSFDGDAKELAAPTILDQSTKLHKIFKRPKPGYEYRIYWEW